DDVARQFRGDADMEFVVLGAGDAVEGDELAGAVDVALHDVSAKAAVGAQGKLEVHERTFADAREGSAVPGFFGQVEPDGMVLEIDGRQADAADRDRIAGLEFLD